MMTKLFMRKLFSLVALTLALAVTIPCIASANVLIEPPHRSISEGDLITLGVWYQSYSGGSHYITVRIYKHGHRVAYRRIRATTRWRTYTWSGATYGRYIMRISGSGWNVRYRITVHLEDEG